jgi:hypothetical protein
VPVAEPFERAALYRFLARVYLAPPDDDLLALVADVPELAPLAGSGLADRHTWLFDFNIYPYAGVFLDPSGMLDSPWAGFVAGVYRALGFEVVPGAGLAGPDHLAALLEALSALLEREGEAGDVLAAERARHGQRTLLREHLAPWLPSFLAAVRRVDDGFYAEVGALAREVVVDHLVALAGATDAAGADAVADPTATGASGGRVAGDPPPDAGAEASDGDPPPGLTRLLIRAQSGLFVSRADLAALGERMTLPLRFAERRFMLDHLVRGAAERDALPELVTLVGALVERERTELVAWSGDAPALALAWRPWIDRLDATATWLVEVAVDGGELAWRDLPPDGGP